MDCNFPYAKDPKSTKQTQMHCRSKAFTDKHCLTAWVWNSQIESIRYKYQIDSNRWSSSLCLVKHSIRQSFRKESLCSTVRAPPQCCFIRVVWSTFIYHNKVQLKSFFCGLQSILIEPISTRPSDKAEIS